MFGTFDAIQPFGFCVSGDLESYARYASGIWADEFPGHEMLQEKQLLEREKRRDQTLVSFFERAAASDKKRIKKR